MNILHMDASCRHSASLSRRLSKFAVDRLLSKYPDSKITYRDLSTINIINQNYIESRHLIFDKDKNVKQSNLQESYNMTSELLQADIIVLGSPIYNFGAPASLKAWSEHVAIPNTTFKKTDNKIIGLLENKKVYVAVTSMTTIVGSDVDTFTPWLRVFFAFIGVSEVTFFAMDKESLLANNAYEDIRQKIAVEIG